MANHIPTIALAPNATGSFPNNNKPRWVTADGDVMYGFGATEPTTWSKLSATPNSGINVSIDFDKIWFWNSLKNSTVNINVHEGL